jgi:predicted MarR family transcription regulator
MTSVGYGDMLPNTYFGRFCALCMAIFGAFLLGLVVNVIAVLFDLQNKKKEVLCRIT